MNCKRAEYLIAATVSGTIDKAEKEKMLQHIKACPKCHEIYEKQKTIEAELLGIGAPFPDVDFAKRVSKAVKEMETRPFRPGIREVFSWVTPFSALCITFALAIAFIWIVFNGAFIEWIRNCAVLVGQGITTPHGLILSISFSLIILVLVCLGVRKTIRNF